LPTKITFGTTGSIVYIYNANGIKTEKEVIVLPQKKSTTTTRTVTNYLSGFQYNTISQSSPIMRISAPETLLQFFPMAEGYIKNTVISGVNTYDYVFNYTDHLGNVRLSYSDTDKNGIIASSEIVEENNYYPFGLKHKGYNDGLPNTYKYKYNGKELQDELNLNVTAMDFRMYDNALGRFYGIDVLAELTPSETPNHFGHNNPVYWSDPSGLWSYKAFGNADTSVNMTNSQWLASQRPSDSPMAQLDAMNVNNKNLVSSSPYGSWYKKKIGQRASWEKDNGDFQLETITLENIYTNVFVANGGGSNFDNSSIALDIGGGIFGAFQGLTASQGQWLGNNGKYYSSSWGGNQYTGSRSGAFKVAGNYKMAGTATVIVVAGIGIYNTIEGYQKDGGQFGYNAQMAAASSAGSIVGGLAGAEAGVLIGAGIGAWFGGVGAIPGAVIGGVIGGFGFGMGGGYLGGYLGGSAVNYYHGR
jgi:RHS repeat-associated protein